MSMFRRIALLMLDKACTFFKMNRSSDCKTKSKLHRSLRHPIDSDAIVILDNNHAQSSY